LPQPPATKLIGSPFIELQSVDSTNNYALAQAHAGLAQHGMAIFAHEQVAGKGQRGKIWKTEKDTSLIMSTVIKPGPLLPAQQFWLNASVAVAVHKFFMHYAGQETKIKWPNDLYWQDRKAGGILIENIIGTDDLELMGREQRKTQWKWAIIGTGININQAIFPTALQNPVSLKQITGKDFDVVHLAKELCQLLNSYFEQLISKGFENIYSEYLSHLYKINETVKLKKGNRVFEAMIKGISPTGKLTVQHAIEEEFDFGDVEWVIGESQ
jgi:BirA family transcriptional regulator, biotin operon repressor / biotin---[acetyl-CoA-carboxylase] ligase